MNLYKTFVRPLLFQFYPENAHNKIILSGKIVEKMNNPLFEYIGDKTRYKNRKLETRIFGSIFENPIGLAAGFDKNAEIVAVAHYACFGFGEIGSATAIRNNGNKQIRIHRLIEDESILNRVGLGNDGIDKIVSRVQKSKIKIPYFINITKTPYENIAGEKAIEDILYSFRKAYESGNGTVISISCPNSIDGKLFEEPDSLEKLLSKIDDERQSYNWKPVFLKLSPDIKDDILVGNIEICRDYEINGFVAGNTASYTVKTKCGIDECGISGKRLKEKSNNLIRRVYELKDDDQIIIGCGGIFNAEDAYEKVKLGSSLDEILTVLPYEGNVVPKINKGLAMLLERDGFKNLEEAVGYDAK